MKNKKQMVLILALLAVRIVMVIQAEKQGYRKGYNKGAADAHDQIYNNPRVNLDFCLVEVERGRHIGYEYAKATLGPLAPKHKLPIGNLTDWLVDNENAAEQADVTCEAVYRNASKP